LLTKSADFSKNFKQDVSNILIKLRSNKLLTIDNDTLQLKISVDIPQQDICQQDIFQQIIENHTSQFNYIYILMSLIMLKKIIILIIVLIP
jgi:ribosome maturation protein Sdo1